MALFTFKPLQQNQLSSSFTLCKYSSTFTTFKFYTFSPTKHKHTLQVRAQVTHLETKSPSTDQSTKTHRNSDKTISSRLIDKRVNRINGKNSANSVLEDNIKKRDTKLKGRHARNKLGSERRREVDSGLSSLRSKDENSAKNEGSKVLRDKMDKISKKGKNDQLELGVEKKRKGSKKNKVDTPEPTLRIGLDMCSKRGDVMSAIRLYDLARTEGINMGQYHYAVLLYLCSSAAAGVVQPAKSGSGIRSLSMVESSNEGNRLSSASSGLYGKMGEQVLDNGGFVESGNIHENFNTNELNTCHNLNGKEKSNLFSNGSIEQRPQTLNCMIHSMKLHYESSKTKDCGIHVSEDVKKYALERGFEIYEKMVLEKVPMNEATLTSVARMAMSTGDGDMAFNMVKQMKALGINPRLRSYGPALSVFCKNGDIEKALTVEEHMIEHGVYPEEPELEALLTVSIESGRSDKVYYLLHKLRTSVRKVSPSTADLIEKWFNTKTASRVGKIKWDKKLIKDAIESGGGGWHGQGWLGRGKWAVSRTFVGADGLCKCCGEKLVTIDLDPAETEHFAESVASIAKEREKNSGFEKFQKWLEYYGPFEAVVDAANVGLFSQRKFRPAKVKAIVNGIRPMLPSKKWPLIVLHNRRLTGDKMDEPFNKALIEKWKNADALYATPTGSNDDWYWLYAAIKCKCLLVTNDEMRDHLFQLLGNDFFPKWKERHQVRFGFSEIGPIFHMPPPCSVVIQESEKGCWHIPVVSEQDSEEERTWLCITRAKTQMARKDFPTIHEELHFSHPKMGHASSDSRTETQVKPPPLKQGNNESTKYHSPYINRNRRIIVSPSDHHTMLSQIEAAENLGSCVIDFQI